MPITGEGKHYRFKDLEYYAFGGFVVIVDHRQDCPPGQRKVTLGAEEFKERVIAMSAELKRHKYGDELQEAIDLYNNGVACADEALAMGSPFDAETRAYVRRHKLWRTPTLQVQPAPTYRPGKKLIVPGN